MAQANPQLRLTDNIPIPLGTEHLFTRERLAAGSMIASLKANLPAGVRIRSDAEMDGTLQKKEAGPNQTLILTLASGSQKFRAIVSSKGRASFPWTLEEKSRLLLQGICVVDPTYTQNQAPFALILPAIDDIQVMHRPPWWSTWWFQALSATACLTLLWGLYRVRIRQLRHQEKKLRDVIETMPTFAWTALPDGSRARPAS